MKQSMGEHLQPVKDDFFYHLSIRFKKISYFGNSVESEFLKGQDDKNSSSFIKAITK